MKLIGKEFKGILEREGGRAIGVLGSNRTTNEENYLLQKFARVVLQTNNIDHHRTADFPALAAALRGKPEMTASMRDVYNAPAILLIGNDPTEQHPLLAWQIRNNVRLHGARLYVVNSQPIKLRRQAASFSQIPEGREGKLAAFLAGDDSALGAISDHVDAGDSPAPDPSTALGQARRAPVPTRVQWSALRDKLRAEQNLVIIFGSELCGADISIAGELRLRHLRRKVYLPG